MVLPGLTAVIGKVVAASWESRLIRRGLAVVSVRKLSTALAAAGQWLAAVGFVKASRPELATVCYCLQTLAGSFHYAGLEPNYIDVGGKDIARIKGFLNTFLWASNALLSLLIVRLRLATNRWAYIFLLPPTLQLGTAVVYLRWASDKTYREYRALRARRAELRAAAAAALAAAGGGAEADDKADDMHGATAELRKLSSEAAERQRAARQARQQRPAVPAAVAGGNG